MRAYTAGKSTKRRPKRPMVNPLSEVANLVGNILFERAQEFANQITEGVPVDGEPLDDEEQWAILENVAFQLNPYTDWPDASAIERLIELRRKFAPPTRRYDAEGLTARAKQLRREERGRLDLTITPANPEYDKMLRRIGAD